MEQLEKVPIHKDIDKPEYNWLIQWNRMMRWLEDIPSMDTGEEIDEYKMDKVFAFFLTAYHLRDWMSISLPHLKSDINKLFNCTEMQLCRDICNGTKHLQLISSKIDNDLNIYKESSVPEERKRAIYKYFVVSDQKKYGIFELVEKVYEKWFGFLKSHREIWE